MFKDFLAKQPISVVVATEIEEDKIHLPTKVNPNEFYKEHQPNIEVESLSTEKAVYLASVNSPKRTMTIRSLLVNGR